MYTELDITDFFSDAEPFNYSASQAELGVNAGRITWNAACDDASQFPLLDSDEKRDAFRSFVRGFGAWDETEIAAWSDTELTALLLQFIAGDIRESNLDCESPDWDQYQLDAEAGRVSSRIYRGDDGHIYYGIGD